MKIQIWSLKPPARASLLNCLSMPMYFQFFITICHMYENKQLVWMLYTLVLATSNDFNSCKKSFYDYLTQSSPSMFLNFSFLIISSLAWPQVVPLNSGFRNTKENLQFITEQIYKYTHMMIRFSPPTP